MGLGLRGAPRQEADVIDLLTVGLTLAFFAATFGLVALLDRL
ncbi:hypothetical protein [Anaeromyxobacter sp. PSR-1]|nr:hypothetical protein [Anaeromyxobacter sp. PSR-1]GAO03805.1 hypothetical protein PSR1_02691 [Anaeromyxobacter sp. PSR-1]